MEVAIPGNDLVEDQTTRAKSHVRKMARVGFTTQKNNASYCMTTDSAVAVPPPREAPVPIVTFLPVVCA
jgi:hypothetical protein